MNTELMVKVQQLIYDNQDRLEALVEALESVCEESNTVVTPEVKEPYKTLQNGGCMKYMLFAYNVERPRGGWGDYMGLFDSVEEAEECHNEYEGDNKAQIVDATSLQKVKDL